MKKQKARMSTWKRSCLHFAEAFRSAAEYVQLHKEWPALRDSSPAGDGHPVLILPAFTTNDWSTAPLRRMLNEKGYKAYGWENGFNFGIRERTAKKIIARLKKIYKENGGQKVSLVGHSLGGIYARAIAQEFPEMVRDVVTIGTPFGIGMHRNATPKMIVGAIQLLTDKRYNLENPGVPERLLTPPDDVPTTSIFSKTDVIGGWEACLNPATPLAENIEVHASHVGSVWSPATVSIILDRLAQPEGAWKPYKHPADETPPPNPGWHMKPGDKSFFPKG